MIIVGYQGIGKSTISSANTSIIDLESGNFWIDGERPKDWYKIYVNIAEHLSNQGYTVFLSSHKIVREELNNRKIPFYIIAPSLALKESWVQKLADRYNTTNKEKDYKAWKNAEQCYEDNISDLASEKCYFSISNIDYSLLNIIDKIKNNEFGIIHKGIKWVL